MKTASPACPHCGSHNHRLLADQLGGVGWCRDCHRTWEAGQSRPAAPLSPRRDGVSPREHRRA